jgi:hypothetical protein
VATSRSFEAVRAGYHTFPVARLGAPGASAPAELKRWQKPPVRADKSMRSRWKLSKISYRIRWIGVVATLNHRRLRQPAFAQGYGGSRGYGGQGSDSRLVQSRTTSLALLVVQNSVVVEKYSRSLSNKIETPRVRSQYFWGAHACSVLVAAFCGDELSVWRRHEIDCQRLERVRDRRMRSPALGTSAFPGNVQPRILFGLLPRGSFAIAPR